MYKINDLFLTKFSLLNFHAFNHDFRLFFFNLSLYFDIYHNYTNIYTTILRGSNDVSQIMQLLQITISLNGLSTNFLLE